MTEKTDTASAENAPEAAKASGTRPFPPCAWEGAPVTHANLVLEGGAMRGQFTAGVLDFFMDQKLFCERVIGVSAGALCGGLASLFLVIFGYDGMAAAQTASCVQGIYWVNGLMVAIPGLLIILCTLPYKLDRKAVQEATAKLQAAREKVQK